MQAQQQALTIALTGLAEMPEILVDKLTERGFKPNPAGLAEATNIPVNTAYRLCRYGHQHRALRQVNRISQALDWTFDYFFEIATTHHQEKVAELINARLKELGLTERAFARKVFLNESYKAGPTAYTTGSASYTYLKTYATICRVLDIKPKLLAKALLRIHHVYKFRKAGSMSELEARHLRLDLKLKLYTAA